MTDRDDGFTLIELLVYTALSIIVLLIVGGIFINSVNAERTVRGVNDATNTGQVAAKSVTNGVRNSSNIQLTVPSIDTQLLMTRSVGSAATPVWTCNAWHVGNGEIRWKQSATAITAPDATELASWTLLSADMKASGLIPVVVTTPLLDPTPRGIDLTFESNTGTSKAVLIKTSAASRQPIPTGADTPICF